MSWQAVAASSGREQRRRWRAPAAARPAERRLDRAAGVLVGSVTAFAGTWWLQHSDVNAELRGVARVLAMDLADRATTVELGAVAVRPALGTRDARWCVRGGAVPTVLTSPGWRRRCARFNPELDC